MHQNCVKKFGCRLAASDYYILLRIRSSLLLIIYLVLMCNNDVIMSIYYYLRIIDLCANGGKNAATDSVYPSRYILGGGQK